MSSPNTQKNALERDYHVHSLQEGRDEVYEVLEYGIISALLQHIEYHIFHLVE